MQKKIGHVLVFNSCLFVLFMYRHAEDGQNGEVVASVRPPRHPADGDRVQAHRGGAEAGQGEGLREDCAEDTPDQLGSGQAVREVWVRVGGKGDHLGLLSSEVHRQLLRDETQRRSWTEERCKGLRMSLVPSPLRIRTIFNPNTRLYRSSDMTSTTILLKMIYCWEK